MVLKILLVCWHFYGSSKIFLCTVKHSWILHQQLAITSCQCIIFNVPSFPQAITFCIFCQSHINSEPSLLCSVTKYLLPENIRILRTKRLNYSPIQNSQFTLIKYNKQWEIAHKKVETRM